MPNQSLALMARKLDQWNSLKPEERAAVLALPFTRRKLRPNDHIVWDGDKPHFVCLLMSGFALRQKVAGNGGRQILSIHMKGDLIDLQNSLLGVADHNLQMLTTGEIAMIPVEDIRDLAFRMPGVGMAMWYETLVEASIFREWILNVGRRDARTRIGHLLCEFAIRLEQAELGNKTEYELPITQEQMADAVALTSVHVNRTLMGLQKDGFISRTKRQIVINDWQKLAKVSDFQPRYLHMKGLNAG